MKKIISLLLAVAILLLCCACGPSQYEIQRQQEELHQKGQKAYEDLFLVATGYMMVLQGFLKTWQFTVYNTTSITSDGREAVVNVGYDYAKTMGLDYEELLDLLLVVAPSSKNETFALQQLFLGNMLASDPDFSIKIVRAYFADTISDLDETLKDTLVTIRELSEGDLDLNGVEELTAFYQDLQKIGKYIDSPTGTFYQYQEKMTEYFEVINEHVSKLDFIYGEFGS